MFELIKQKIENKKKIGVEFKLNMAKDVPFKLRGNSKHIEKLIKLLIMNSMDRTIWIAEARVTLEVGIEEAQE
jgi:cytochrome c oxidase assembly protein Cox11